LAQTRVFLKAKTSDGISSSKELKVKICGLENLSASSYEIDASYPKGSGQIKIMNTLTSDDADCDIT
jgi:hypothetical protein